MSRALKLSILLAVVAAIMTGCHHRPYYGGDSYGHGYNHYSSSSLILRGHFGDHDDRYWRYRPKYRKHEQREHALPGHDRDHRKPHRTEHRKHRRHNRDAGREYRSRVLKRYRDDDRGERRSKSRRHERRFDD